MASLTCFRDGGACCLVAPFGKRRLGVHRDELVADDAEDIDGESLMDAPSFTVTIEG